MPLFFIIFFTIYSLANFYVLRRFFQALPSVPDFVRYILLVIFVLAALAYILTRALLAANTSILYDIALWIGSFWFAFLLYGFIYCLLVDEVRLLNYLLNRYTHYQL
jgi:hypothetical protein